MTTRQVAFATARYWNILPHVIWHYPFRYFKELRDFYFASLQPPTVHEAVDPDSIDFDVNAEMFRGDSL
jgi:hypothetical protein